MKICRFFRHQASYSLLPAKPGGQADRVIILYKYKVVGVHPTPSPAWTNFTLMAECTPESRRYYFVYSVG